MYFNNIVLKEVFKYVFIKHVSPHIWDCKYKY